jgi:hypothetical protein
MSMGIDNMRDSRVLSLSEKEVRTEQDPAYADGPRRGSGMRW